MYQEMPTELKEKALKMLETDDIDSVCKMLRIRKRALKRMLQDESISPRGLSVVYGAVEKIEEEAADNAEEEASDRIRKHYTPEFKSAALAMMKEKGAVATIKELGLSSYTLYDWKKKAEGDQYPAKSSTLAGKARKRYTKEFIDQVIASYLEKGRDETLREYGIVQNTLYNWLNEAEITLRGRRH